MNILITGCSGFIGSALVSYLNQQGHVIYGCSRKNVQNDHIYKHLVCDLELGIEENLDIDVIIHTAAQSPEAGLSFNIYFKSNIRATEMLLKYAKRQGVKKIVYLAAVSSYGNIDGVLTEKTPHIEPNDYGLTKYVAEKLVRESGISNRILVLPGVIGMGCKDNWLIKAATQIERSLALDYYNSNALFNNVVDIDDLCVFIGRIIQGEWSDSQTYLLAAREKWKVREVLEYLVNRMDSRSQLRDRLDEKKSFYIDCTKALYNGFDPKSLEQILEKVCKIVRN